MVGVHFAAAALLVIDLFNVHVLLKDFLRLSPGTTMNGIRIVFLLRAIAVMIVVFLVLSVAVLQQTLFRCGQRLRFFVHSTLEFT